MPEDAPEIKNFVVAPSNLQEFLNNELRYSKEALRIDEYNFEVFKQGEENTTLQEFYGGIEGAESSVLGSRTDFQSLEEADRTLKNGNDSLAREILKKRVKEAEDGAAENFKLTGSSPITEMYLTDMNILRNLRDKLPK